MLKNVAIAMLLEIDTNVKLGTYHDNQGYAFYCVRDTTRKEKKYHLYEHRILAYAWDKIDSVFFSNDLKEVHHIDPDKPKWYNLEDNLMGLSPLEHMDLDPDRAKISTPWDNYSD